MSRKLNELKEKYGVRTDSAAFINRVDPTESKKYIEWLFKVRYRGIGNGRYIINEDFPSTRETEIRDSLVWFERNLNGKIPAEFRDINKFKTITEFINKISEIKTPSRSEVKNEVRVVFEDDSWKVIVPLTFEASKMYGAGTKWCTTNKSHYESYMKNGLLYYIIDKSHNRKFGLPISSGYGLKSIITNETLAVFNNEDRSINIATLRTIYGNSLNKFLEAIDKDFKDVIKIRLRKTVLEQAINNIRKLKTDLNNLDLKEESIDNNLDSLIKTFFEKMG